MIHERIRHNLAIVHAASPGQPNGRSGPPLTCGLWRLRRKALLSGSEPWWIAVYWTSARTTRRNSGRNREASRTRLRDSLAPDRTLADEQGQENTPAREDDSRGGFAQAAQSAERGSPRPGRARRRSASRSTPRVNVSKHGWSPRRSSEDSEASPLAGRFRSSA